MVSSDGSPAGLRDAALRLGAQITLRKKHPCGGAEWRVERLGADIGVRCLTCGHYLLTPRRKLERAVKSSAPPASQSSVGA